MKRTAEQEAALAQWQQGGKPSKRSKYNAMPTMAFNQRFHSAREASYYGELLLREKIGEISNIRRQVPYVLHAWNAYEGQKAIGKYLADFVADVRTISGIWHDGLIVDVKGYDLAFGRWKRAHAEHEYGIKIQIVK